MDSMKTSCLTNKYLRYRHLVMIPTHRQGLCPGCPRPGPGVVMVEDEVLAVLLLVDWAHLAPSCIPTLNTVQHCGEQLPEGIEMWPG